MAEPTIRAATPQDVRDIAALVASAYDKYLARMDRPPAPMLADYGHLVEEDDAWVLDLDGELVGLAVLKSEADHLLVENVAVSPAHQGQGFGSRLLAFAEAQARERRLGEMRLFTNEMMHENVAIYGRLGWSEYGRVEQDGYRRVLMRKATPRTPD